MKNKLKIYSLFRMRALKDQFYNLVRVRKWNKLKTKTMFMMKRRKKRLKILNCSCNKMKKQSRI